MSKVSLLRVDNYNIENLELKIKEAISLIGSIDELIKKDSKVFIKLNCVGPFGKDTGITTHPAFVEAVIKIVLEKTKNIIIGDNPATKDITSVLKKNGVYEVVQKYNLKIIDGKDSVKITNPNPHIYSEFEVSREYIECDTLINLPKLKTHTLTYMTCAEKNFFGLIFGLQKAGWHVKASNPLEFGQALNDLYGALLNSFKEKTILNICDGILGLDGDGPSTGGFAVMCNAILASTDAISLDTIACRLVKLNEEKIFVTNIGAERGYGENKNIEIIGDSLDKFVDVKFEGPKSTLSSFGLRLLKKKFFRNLLLEHPKINKNICLKCGECAKICPPKTMVIKPKEFPHLKTNQCIRCWCCAEVCPANAIVKSHRPLIGKIVFSIKL